VLCTRFWIFTATYSWSEETYALSLLGDEIWRHRIVWIELVMRSQGQVLSSHLYGQRTGTAAEDSDHWIYAVVVSVSPIHHTRSYLCMYELSVWAVNWNVPRSEDWGVGLIDGMVSSPPDTRNDGRWVYY
jgi:hypothetical protein